MIVRDLKSGQMEELAISLKGDGERTYLESDNTRYADFSVPFSREEVENVLSDFSSKRMQTDPRAWLGSTLFSALFSGELGRKLWERMAEVESQNRALRLRIISNLERTQHLPWELLFDPSRGDFMSLSGRVALVRTRPENFDPATELEPLTRLRILAVVADPTGLMETEKDLDALKQIVAIDPRVELEVLHEATPKALEARLDGGPFDVFHFAGTGEVLPVVSKKGGVRQALRFMGPVSNSLVDRQELGQMLGKAGVRLAVLNACHTDWIARSLSKYIPAAIGFREEVTVRSCLTAADSLYRAVLASTPLELAVTAARQAVDRAQPGSGDWCKLVFYLQHRNGRFLTATAAPGAPMRASRAPGDNREVAKLTRLLDLYETNLAVLERGVASTTGADVFKEQSVALKEKIASTREQLTALNGPGKTR